MPAPRRLIADKGYDANSLKTPMRQIHVIEDIATQIARGNRDIFGIMIESHLVEGRQNVVEGQQLTYGQSITDACIGWEDTETVLSALASASRKRRN